MADNFLTDEQLMSMADQYKPEAGSSASNPLQEDSLGAWERAQVMNLAVNPESAVKWIQKRHPDWEVAQYGQGYNISIRKPGEKWKVVDPDNFEPLDDLTDIVTDLGLGVASAVGGTIGAVSGGTAGSVVPFAGTAAGVTTGAVAGAGIGTAAGEVARQGLGSLAGFEAPLGERALEVGTQGVLGAAGEGLARGVVAGGKAVLQSNAVKNLMRKASPAGTKVVSEAVPPISATAPEHITAARTERGPEVSLWDEAEPGMVMEKGWEDKVWNPDLEGRPGYGTTYKHEPQGIYRIPRNITALEEGNIQPQFTSWDYIQNEFGGMDQFVDKNMLSAPIETANEFGLFSGVKSEAEVAELLDKIILNDKNIESSLAGDLTVEMNYKDKSELFSKTKIVLDKLLPYNPQRIVDPEKRIGLEEGVRSIAFDLNRTMKEIAREIRKVSPGATEDQIENRGKKLLKKTLGLTDEEIFLIKKIKEQSILAGEVINLARQQYTRKLRGTDIIVNDKVTGETMLPLIRGKSSMNSPLARVIGSDPILKLDLKAAKETLIPGYTHPAVSVNIPGQAAITEVIPAVRQGIGRTALNNLVKGLEKGKAVASGAVRKTGSGMRSLGEAAAPLGKNTYNRVTTLRDKAESTLLKLSDPEEATLLGSQAEKAAKSLEEAISLLDKRGRFISREDTDIVATKVQDAVDRIKLQKKELMPEETEKLAKLSGLSKEAGKLSSEVKQQSAPNLMNSLLQMKRLSSTGAGYAMGGPMGAAVAAVAGPPLVQAGGRGLALLGKTLFESPETLAKLAQGATPKVQALIQSVLKAKGRGNDAYKASLYMLLNNSDFRQHMTQNGQDKQQ